jgi:hypothetical protein
VRFILFENRAEGSGEALFAARGLMGVVILDEVVDVPDAVLADRETGLRVEDRHIILVAYGDEPFAEAADVLHWRVFCHDSFLRCNSSFPFRFFCFLSIIKGKMKISRRGGSFAQIFCDGFPLAWDFSLCYNGFPTLF